MRRYAVQFKEFGVKITAKNKQHANSLVNVYVKGGFGNLDYQMYSPILTDFKDEMERIRIDHLMQDGPEELTF